MQTRVWASAAGIVHSLHVHSVVWRAEAGMILCVRSLLLRLL